MSLALSATSVLPYKPGLLVRSFGIQRGTTLVWMVLLAIWKAMVRVAAKETPQVLLTAGRLEGMLHMALVESRRHPANRNLPRKRWKLPSSLGCEACLSTFAATRSATGMIHYQSTNCEPHSKAVERINKACYSPPMCTVKNSPRHSTSPVQYNTSPALVCCVVVAGTTRLCLFTMKLVLRSPPYPRFRRCSSPVHALA